MKIGTTGRTFRTSPTKQTTLNNYLKGIHQPMDIPSNLYYTKSHEWARIEGNICTIGITDFAVEELNKEIVNVDLPEVGTSVKQGETFGVLDAVKAAFDLYAPMSGKVEAVNNSILDDPTLVAMGPFTDGWMIRIALEDAEEAKNLMDAKAYQQHVESEAH